MEQPKYQQHPQPIPLRPPDGEAHMLYRNSVVGMTEERMRQLAEHFSP